MLCIVRTDPNTKEITGWIIAVDIDEARRQAQAAMDRELTAVLYRMTFMPQPGKYEVLSNCWMLVS